MTTLAQQAVKKASTRRKLSFAELPIEDQCPFGHFAGWGAGKTGKTDIGLRTRSHEVRAPGKKLKPDDPFSKTEPGEILIPSRPLSIAYANWDRDVKSVLVNLPRDVDIQEERFYLDEDNEPIFAVDNGIAAKLMKRWFEFITEFDGAVDMIVFDGGTAVWEQIRQVTLPAPAGVTPEGEPHHLPRQYGPANQEMRNSIMQRLYNARAHTWLTMEAGQLWQSASGPVVNPITGEAELRQDGWNKTRHYSDVTGQVAMKKLASSGWTRVYTPGPESLKPAMIGVDMPNPSYAGIYRAAYPTTPLLKAEDREKFVELQAKHDGKLMWE